MAARRSTRWATRASAWTAWMGGSACTSGAGLGALWWCGGGSGSVQACCAVLCFRGFCPATTPPGPRPPQVAGRGARVTGRRHALPAATRRARPAPRRVALPCEQHLGHQLRHVGSRWGRGVLAQRLGAVAGACCRSQRCRDMRWLPRPPLTPQVVPLQFRRQQHALPVRPAARGAAAGAAAGGERARAAIAAATWCGGSAAVTPCRCQALPAHSLYCVKTLCRECTFNWCTPVELSFQQLHK